MNSTQPEYQARFAWKDALLSFRGPKAPIRHALLTLWTHAKNNCIAYPTQKQLALETGRSERHIRKQLDDGEALGWIIRTRRFNPASGHYHYVYRLTIPELVYPCEEECKERQTNATRPAQDAG
jgi:hypothetical protein